MYQATPSRAVLGIAGGAAVGAVAVVALLLGIPLYLEGESFADRVRFPTVAFAAAVAFAIWAVGLSIVAVPCWRILHRRGWRDWRAAIALGFALTFLANLALSTGFGFGFGSGYSAGDGGGMTVVNGRMTIHGWSRALAGALFLSPLGMLVGWAVWRIAYRWCPPASAVSRQDQAVVRADDAG
ncbi:hypothetical protein [Phreatobacter sp. AB_2022a]|uniref:hypothetical protein n=1 Tax=Phreatobacter sp. AB_2022a TaxID=3003134 RepID=UPI00228769E2|nr:hypothetical protein [Phreatobacter sp. AB_2022a]MCZ0738226.1 hypothetical protein [Phreatobacter sp. AB_2022a]